MDKVAVGFWGAFFGSAGLLAAGSLLAFARSKHRVALLAGLTALLSALYPVAYLGWLPIADRDTEQRLLANVAAVTSALLGLMLMAMLGLMRSAPERRRAQAVMYGAAVLVVVVGWQLRPAHALWLGSILSLVICCSALGVSVRSALRGDRLAWPAASGMAMLVVGLALLNWIAINEIVDWPLHAVSAIAGIGYLCAFSIAMWSRYSYLIELREVMAHGPSYDPVTRMRTHAETSQLAGTMFLHKDGDARPIGVIVVSIGNLYALEKLHGRGATNHALFVCAGRLRRTVPGDVQMGRLGEDGFLLLTRNSDDPAALVEIARQVAARLARPVQLNTTPDPLDPAGARAVWIADVGVGVLAAATPLMRPSAAVSMARAMSRTAWSYSSRIAWFDRDTRRIAELPTTDQPA